MIREVSHICHTHMYMYLETMLSEMGSKSKLPINVTKGSMAFQCDTFFPKILAI